MNYPHLIWSIRVVIYDKGVVKVWLRHTEQGDKIITKKKLTFNKNPYCDSKLS